MSELNQALKRLESFRDIEAGWLDGHGSAVSSQAVDKAKMFLEILSKAGSPASFPMEDGGVSLEWVLGTRIISLDFFPERDEEHCDGDIFVADLSPFNR